MRIVTAPDYESYEHDKTIFIAGGISGCPDWQKEFLECLGFYDPELVCYNPRRSYFNVEDSSVSTDQIAWERNYLDKADAIVFWFPEETLCPITLFELGVAIGRGDKEIFVGCHPNYTRKFDVETQLDLAGLRYTMSPTFFQLIASVILWAEEGRRYSTAGRTGKFFL